MGQDDSLGQRLRAVLAVPGSPLAATAHAVMTGAQAGLCSALQNCADPAADPGFSQCAALADELGLMLSGGAVPAAVNAPVAESQAGTPEAVALSAATDAFCRDPQVERFLGGVRLPEDSAGGAWRYLWLACLRLESRAAASWRQRIKEMVGPVTGSAAEGEWITLPLAGMAPQVLIEPAPALGEAGLRLAADGPASAEVLAALKPAEEPGARRSLAELATLILAMIGLDPETCHGLEGVRTSGLHPLHIPENRMAFERELMRRLTELRMGEDPVARLQAMWLVDEALCSVVHRPPAHPRSWWGHIADRSRALLREQVKALREQGGDTELRVLELKPYMDLRPYTSGRDIAFSLPETQGGKVLACLRTWLRVGNDIRPGRVIFSGE